MGVFNSLSLGARNATVTSFNNLVDSKLGEGVKTAAVNTAVDNMIGSVVSNIASSVASNIASNVIDTVSDKAIEFGLDLYMKALKLPECQNISFDYMENIGTTLLGKFTGGKTYKDFSGNLSTTVKNVASQFGRAILDNQSFDLSLFTNNDSSFIIAFDDFTVEPLISDFTSLYQVLLTETFDSIDTYNDDTNLVSSLVTTFGSYLSSAIIDNTSQEPAENYLSSIDEFKSNVIQNDNIALPTVTGGGVINPSNISQSVADKVKDIGETVSSDSPAGGILEKVTEAVNILSKPNKENTALDLSSSVQAIIFDVDHKMPVLKCWQLPESISYTASAQYDNVATRGTQQPFQFYNCANQINLSFTLKWHIDELYDNKTNYNSLQEIAEAAEAFTRPYYEGNSLQPKVCGVILPSIAQIGYLTEAQITYSGAVTGIVTTGKSQRGLSASNEVINSFNINTFSEEPNFDALSYRYNESYEYSTLEISFQLVVIKDVSLVSSKENDRQEHEAEEEAKRKAAEEEADKKLTEDIANADDATKSHLNADKMMSEMDQPPASEEQIMSSLESYVKELLEGYGTATPVNGQGR